MFTVVADQKAKAAVFWLCSGPLWELSCAALKLSPKSWRRNVPNTQTWILARPDFTSTRRTSKRNNRESGNKHLETLQITCR